MMNMNAQPPRSRDLASRGQQVINGYYNQYNYPRTPQAAPKYPNAMSMGGQVYGYPDPYNTPQPSAGYNNSMLPAQQLQYPQCNIL